ncbi:hypothetical protein CYMTET_12039 [Cymbomonas tetramitiformis]|uniref:Uncharacterized protein n=1 Tax=Cymbomonas tetramitiformis TaxID=36881 RepID=A0AAE0GKW4_9CHLO|nr:hypothetical protein CYMTET_12039 [Cymbomonas tetramitiformis]
MPGRDVLLLVVSRVVAAVVAGKVVMRMTRKATITARAGGESRRIPACAVVPSLLLRRHMAQPRIVAMTLVPMAAVVGVVVGDTTGGSDAASWRVTGGVACDWEGNFCRYSSRCGVVELLEGHVAKLAQIVWEGFVAGVGSGLWSRRVRGGWAGCFVGFAAGAGLSILLAEIRARQWGLTGGDAAGVDNEHEERH